jgi:hypothetical protein
MIARRVAVTLVAATFAVSMLLPWAQEWDDRRSPGWQVALAGSEGYHPALGYTLVALWGLAVAVVLRYPHRRLPGAAAAALVGAVCPGAYWWELTRFRGFAFGRDAEGRFVEWAITATPQAGYVLASAAAVGLFVVALFRVGPPAELAGPLRSPPG